VSGFESLLRHYRLPDGRQVPSKIGPEWTGRGRPAAGYHTKHTAENWLSDVIDHCPMSSTRYAAARSGGMVRTGASLTDAVVEYTRWLEHDRRRKPSTLRDYNHLDVEPFLRHAAGRQQHLLDSG
jgi:hypothetical protein